MNWHELYFATSYHNDIADYLYQHTFKERMGMNWHESYTRSISSLHFYFSEIPTVVTRVVVSWQFLTKKLLSQYQTREYSKFLNSFVILFF